MSPHEGWYPDPEDAELERYWDGRAWTSRTRDPAERQLPRPPGTELPAALLAATAPAATGADPFASLDVVPPPSGEPVVPGSPAWPSAVPQLPGAEFPAGPATGGPYAAAQNPAQYPAQNPAQYPTGPYPGAPYPNGGPAAGGTATPAWPASPATPVTVHVPYSQFDDRPRRSYGATTRSAFAAAILGLQSGPLLLYGLIGVLFGMLASSLGPADQAELSRAGIPTAGISFVGFFVLLLGVAMFATSVGVAMHRGWARIAAVVIEGLAVVLGFISAIAAGSIWPLLFAAFVPIIVIVLIVSER